MNIRTMPKEELENYSLLEMAQNLLKMDKKPKTTTELFREICELLELNESQYQNLVGDFYTSLNLDKRFIIINSKWDLKEHHSVKVVIDDDLDDLDGIDDIEDIDEPEEEIEIKIENDDDDDEPEEEVDILEDDDEDDELDQLTILEDEEQESTDL